MFQVQGRNGNGNGNGWFYLLFLLITLSATIPSSRLVVDAFVRQPSSSAVPNKNNAYKTADPAQEARFLHPRSGGVKLTDRQDYNPSRRRIRIQQFTTSLFSNQKNAGESQDQEKLSQRTKGLLVLLTVPFAWGTYVPVVRYLYALQPAVPGFVFSACYYAIASTTTLGMLAFQERKNNNDSGGERVPVNTDAILPSEQSDDMGANTSTSFPLFAGVELGAYLFIANCLQVIGLKTVPSDRAGFLVQLTTVMVPVAEALSAGNLLAIPAQTWFSCLLAFAGICVMNLDGLGGSSISTILLAFKSFTQGDLLILSAAVLYTLHVVRLGRYAKETTPLKLAASKATVETVYSFGLVLSLVVFAGSGAAGSSSGLLSFAQETGAEISNFFSTISKGIAGGTVPKSAIISALGATLWTGLVTCAYTIYAQSYGQSRVGPTTANLVYSIQPITTSLFAFLLLGETMGPAGIVGGALIGAALYLVTTGSSSDYVVDDTVAGVESTTPLKVNGEQESSQIIADDEDVVADLNRR
jgi:drug/metabolite transporter (DMT)-like permease